MSKKALKSQWSMLLLTGWFKVPKQAQMPRDWRMIYNDHHSDGFVMRYPAVVKPGEKQNQCRIVFGSIIKVFR